MTNYIVSCWSSLGLGRYRYQVSADTNQYQWVSVLADTYLSIGANTSSPVVRSPVQQSTLLQRTPIISSLYRIFAHIPRIHI